MGYFADRNNGGYIYKDKCFIVYVTDLKMHFIFCFENYMELAYFSSSNRPLFDALVYQIGGRFKFECCGGGSSHKGIRVPNRNKLNSLALPSALAIPTWNKKLIPTLAVLGGPYYLARSARRYHLTILKHATTLKKAGPGFAILQLKFLAALHAVNYTNCALYTSDYDLPPLRYCKEMALALLDFSLMGTDVLCDKLSELFVSQNIKIILQKFSVALTEFEVTFRRCLERMASTSEISSNDVDLLRKHAETNPDYYIEWCQTENRILLQPLSDLNEYIKKMKIDGTLPPITRVTQKPPNEIMEVWLQVESIYNKSLIPADGKLDLMKALFNGEMELIIQYKLHDAHIIKSLWNIQQSDFILDENVSNDKIVVKPVEPIGDLISL